MLDALRSRVRDNAPSHLEGETAVAAANADAGNCSKSGSSPSRTTLRLNPTVSA